MFDEYTKRIQEMERLKKKLSIKEAAEKKDVKIVMKPAEIELEDILNEKGKDKLKKVKEIVSSFNYDRSDTMVDYYDRGFYDFYNCVAV